MKKVFTTLAFVLAFVLSMTMITACADNASEPQASATPQVSVPTPPPSPAPAATATTPYLRRSCWLFCTMTSWCCRAMFSIFIVTNSP